MARRKARPAPERPGMVGMLLFLPALALSLRVASGAQVGVVAALALLAALSVGPRSVAILRTAWPWVYLVVLAAALLGASHSPDGWVSLLDHALGALAVLLALSALVRSASASVGERLGAAVRMPALGQALGAGLAAVATATETRPSGWAAALSTPVLPEPSTGKGGPVPVATRADWLAATLGWLLAVILLIVRAMPGSGR